MFGGEFSVKSAVRATISSWMLEIFSREELPISLVLLILLVVDLLLLLPAWVEGGEEDIILLEVELKPLDENVVEEGG